MYFLMVFPLLLKGLSHFPGNSCQRKHCVSLTQVTHFPRNKLRWMLSLVSYPEHYSQVSEKDKSHVFGVISKIFFQNILVGPFLHTAAMAKTLSSGRKTNVKKEIVFIVSIDIIESNKYVTNNYFAICNSGTVCT